MNLRDKVTLLIAVCLSALVMRFGFSSPHTEEWAPCPATSSGHSDRDLPGAQHYSVNQVTIGLESAQLCRVFNMREYINGAWCERTEGPADGWSLIQDGTSTRVLIRDRVVVCVIGSNLSRKSSQIKLDEQSICENFGNGYTIKFNEFQSPFWCYDGLGVAFAMEPREHRAVEVLLGSTDIELFSDSYPKRNLP